MGNDGVQKVRGSPYILPPPSRRGDTMRGSPVGGEVRRTPGWVGTDKGDVVEGGRVDLSWGTKVLMMELHDGIRCVDIAVYCPAVVSSIVALPFDQVFKAVVAHLRV